MKIAIFPGSFDPFTIGHADIVERGLRIFDKIVIAIGINDSKTGLLSPEQRLETIARLYADNPQVEVCTYNGLTADLALSRHATAMLRAVRSIKDYEYERDLADINRQLSNIDTVLLFSDPRLSAICSSTVRELHHFGKDITPYLP